MQFTIDFMAEFHKILSSVTTELILWYLRCTPTVSVNLTNKGTNNKELKNSVLKKLVSLGVPEDLITQDQLAQNFILQGDIK